MRKSFVEFQREERRLVILRLLYDQGEQSMNSSSLYHALDMFGLHCARSEVRIELEWLAHRELVTVHDITPPSSDAPLLLARLTDHGRDVAKGKATEAGVLRPGR